MNGLLEFVFEGLSTSQLTQMVVDIIRNKENIIGAMQDGIDVPEQSVLDSAFWSNIASSGENIACTVNLRSSRIGSKWVKTVTLQIIHYDDKNDLTMLLSTEDCKEGGIFSSEEFFLWARDSSAKYGIENFFGGLDPASDVNTQLFSKNGVGPIREL